MSPFRSAALLLLLSPSLFATTYYVSPSGNDSANGQSQGSAWKTLQHAANVVQGGDTVIALAGTYAGFYLSTSGSSAAPITFTGAPGATAPNPAVVINANNPTTKDRVNLESASYVVMEGFTVLGSNDPNTNRACIRAVGPNGSHAQSVTVRACRCDQGGRWGVFTGFVDDMLVENCECSRSNAEHGIYFSNSGDRPIARNNHIWGNSNCGIHINGDVSQGDEGIIVQALIEKNVIHDNGAGGGSGINCDGVQNSTIRNNLLYANHASGISLYQIDGGGPSSGNVVVNNTIRMATDGRWALNLKDGAVNTTAMNNVLQNDHATHGAIETTSDCLPGLSSDWNAVKDRYSLDDVFLSLAQWKAATGQDTHSFIASVSSLFANPAANDYQLSATSPAIDAGTPANAPSDDLLGKHRPALLGFDVGAYEFGACAGAFASYGSGKPGTGGVTPLLAAAGCPDLAATPTLSVTNGRGGATGVLLVGALPASIPALGGTLLVQAAVGVAFTLNGAAGSAGGGSISWPATVPSDASLTGASVDLQAWIADPAATFGAAATAGLSAVIGS